MGPRTCKDICAFYANIGRLNLQKITQIIKQISLIKCVTPIASLVVAFFVAILCRKVASELEKKTSVCRYPLEEHTKFHTILATSVFKHIEQVTNLDYNCIKIILSYFDAAPILINAQRKCDGIDFATMFTQAKIMWTVGNKIPTHLCSSGDNDSNYIFHIKNAYNSRHQMWYEYIYYLFSCVSIVVKKRVQLLGFPMGLRLVIDKIIPPFLPHSEWLAIQKLSVLDAIKKRPINTLKRHMNISVLKNNQCFFNIFTYAESTDLAIQNKNINENKNENKCEYKNESNNNNKNKNKKGTTVQSKLNKECFFMLYSGSSIFDFRIQNYIFRYSVDDWILDVEKMQLHSLVDLARTSPVSLSPSICYNLYPGGWCLLSYWDQNRYYGRFVCKTEELYDSLLIKEQQSIPCYFNAPVHTPFLPIIPNTATTTAASAPAPSVPAPPASISVLYFSQLAIVSGQVWSIVYGNNTHSIQCLKILESSVKCKHRLQHNEMEKKWLILDDKIKERDTDIGEKIHQEMDEGKHQHMREEKHDGIKNSIPLTQSNPSISLLPNARHKECICMSSNYELIYFIITGPDSFLCKCKCDNIMIWVRRPIIKDNRLVFADIHYFTKDDINLLSNWDNCTTTLEDFCELPARALDYYL